MTPSQANGVWKWVAVVTVTVLVAGAPGIIYALRTWTVADRVDMIQDRQDDVRIRLSILETKLSEIQEDLQDHAASGP